MNIKTKLTIFALTFLFSLGIVCDAHAAWYNASWGYRKSHTVNASSGAGTNYQVKITAHYGSGSDSGGDIYLTSHSRTDFADVVFTASDGTTLQDYWMESKTDSDNAVFWVEVAADLSSTNQEIYIYYGNSGQSSSGSNGSNTFLFFDDFSGASLDTDKWLPFNNGGSLGTSQTGGILSVTANNTDPTKIIADMNGIGQTGNNVAMRVKFQATAGSGVDQRMGLGVKTSTVDGQGLNYVLHNFSAKNSHHFLDDALAWGTDNGGTFTLNTWYTEEAYYDGSAIFGRFDDGTWYSWTRGGRSGYMALNVGGFSETVTSEWDFALIRKIIATEPAHSTWGSEETPSVPIEFISIVDTGGASDSDYSTLSTWETGLGTNLTAPSTLVFSGVVTGTAPIDNSSVTLYRSGASTGVGATVVHTAKTGTQILLKNVSDPTYNFTSGDQWRVDGSNYFQIDATAPGQPQVTAKCRATTEAADTSSLTIDGWDTDSTHYIKIWTDPSENYRHQGKWDVTKYRLVSTYPFDLYETNIKIEGLQINGTGAGNPAGIIDVEAVGSNVEIDNNILKGTFVSTSTPYGIILRTDGTGTAKIWNNLIYDIINGATPKAIYIGGNFTTYIYNNTFYNCGTGIVVNTGTAIAKNNIVKGSGDTNAYVGTFSAGTDFNSTDGTDNIGIGSSNFVSQTFTFADEYNKDFHLDSSDTGAKNKGTILYDSGDDANLNFTTDIDNEARKDVAGSWDIGADENVAKIYRSVGAGATSPLAQGGTADSSYGNMTISGLVATFWRPLPDNVGVGDALQYDQDNTGGIDNIVFITKRIDSTHYSVRKADGTAPDATTSLPNSGWSIYRSYISLSNAEAGTENTGINDTVENFDTGDVNLTTNNLQWNFACFANGTTPDTTAVTISGWTTTADNYMRIYTPTRTDEVGTTQRHGGEWNTSKYYLQVTDATALYIGLSYIKVDGLQATIDSQSSGPFYVVNISGQATANEIQFSNNIIKGNNNSSYKNIGLMVNDSDAIIKAWNNLVYDIYNGLIGGSATYSIIVSSCYTSYLYNNSVIGGYVGMKREGGTVIVKNNVIQNTTVGYQSSSGSFDSTSTNNLSDHADAPGSNPQNTKTVSFADSTNKDFHLAPGDSVARNIGTDLTNDSYLPIQTDIDSSGSIDGKSCDVVYQDACLTRPRATSWDIGADELITKIYRSVGVGTTAAIISGTSPAISLTISGNTGTFATWPTSADFGVGDVIRYDSDNNGSLDSTAFISAIDSTAKTATLQNSTGGAPTAMAVGDFDWKLYRAYTSLYNWEAGSENTGIGVTYDSGNRDIATNSEQWNVACYANSGTAPDTTSISINGWTTAQQNYIKVYTPTSTSEVTISQRHQGKWDANKYKMEITDATNLIVSVNYVRIEGLQLKSTFVGGTSTGAISVGSLTANNNIIFISNNIVVGVCGDGTNGSGIGISNNNDNTYISNNIIYGFNKGSMAGIHTYGKTYISNNTIHGNIIGIHLESSGQGIAKNNISYSNSSVNYRGDTPFDPSSTNNLSGPSQTDAPGSNARNAQSVSFVDSVNSDFHLASTDSGARNYGADLSKDLYLPITSDIDSHPRSNLRNSEGSTLGGVAFDIGADEGATAIYRSLAPGATSSIASGTSPANSMIIAGTSVTFGTAPGDTIGVGDAIQYDSDNNGTVDSIAFISARTSGTVYTIQDRTGGTPTSTSATDYDWSIFRAYTSLQNATGSSTGGTENTGLADAVEHFDIDWSASHGKDIYTANQQWNVSAYANSTTADSTGIAIRGGWTTYPTNYLKVHTPTATAEVGTSQRHQGKWDTGKYYLSTSGVMGVVGIYPKYFRIDGIQMLNSATIGWPANTSIYVNSLDSDIQISNNIIRGSYSGITQAFGIATGSYGYVSNTKIWNNIIYGINGGTNDTSIQFSGGNIYAYNNTVYDTDRAYKSDNTAKFFAKNNIAQNCTDGYYGTFDSSSDYNISDVDASDAPNATFTNDYVNVTFADEANDDFHLASNDTAARNSGADLSADTYLPVTTDIDGHARPAPSGAGFDIGADEGATAIYYSVGQSTSTDFKVASNVTVSGYTATFDTAQTGNIGVGDIVTYDGGSCNITGKTSTSIWSCSNVTGGTAPQVTGVAVTSIKRAFASLNSAMSGSTAPQFLNTTDLKTNNYQLNLPCYMDSGTQPDTTAVTIQGYNTAVPNYIKVYTPNNTTTEANQSQRHQGKWDSAKYNLLKTNGTALDIRSNYVRIDGLQVSVPSISSGNSVIDLSSASFTAGANAIYISNSIITGSNSASYYQAGIGGGNNETLYVWNSMLYNFGSADSNSRVIETKYLEYISNTTIIGGYYGLARAAGTVVAKNVYAGGSTHGDYYQSPTLTTSASSDTTGTAGLQSIGVGLTTFTNVTSGSEDYHLPSGAALKNVGTDLSADTSFAFTTDIDGNTRNLNSRGWDIGADESATQIFYSVGQSSSDLKTGSPTLSIDSSGNGTLSVAQTGNMGVGDYIEYGTSPYTKAYISGKTSSTVWTVQSATGSSLGVGTTMPVNSIKHAYTTLNGAIAGASGAIMMNTTDLYTNNLQLSVPCYMDSGTADTTAVTISGYTTYSTNYIKVYTPTSTTTEANNSQRHSGKWDEGKYRLEGSLGEIIILADYVKIDGIQFKTTDSSGNPKNIYVSSLTNGSNKIEISNNILVGVNTGTAYISGFMNDGYNNNAYVWNNIIYGCTDYGLVSWGTAYFYNNSVINSNYSIRNAGTAIVKNNIVQNSTTGYYGTFDSSSTNNISKDATSPNTALRNKTVNFVDSANYDFHLAESDSSARNAGADLSADINLAVTTDIDGNSRPTQGVFDIGADEGATYIYYSVGQNTSDHKTGSPTITLSGYNATLSVGQTAPNMGVGDLITYTGGSCYITAKTNDDKMHWNCQNATGGTAPQVSGVSVTSIAHAFSSLSGALPSSSGGAKGASYLNTTNLYTGNFVLNIPCYYDTGPDTTAVTINGWTTAANNYIRVYTPNNISTETNQSQRHQGKWDDGKYSLNTPTTSSPTTMTINSAYVRIDGLQIHNTNTGTNVYPNVIYITYNSTNSDIQISNNILRADFSALTGSYSGHMIYDNVFSSTRRVWNNIAYSSQAPGGLGINSLLFYKGINYIYNNTIINGGNANENGIDCEPGVSVCIAKNNIVKGFGNSNAYTSSGFTTGTDYNATDGTDTTGQGAHSRISQTFQFVGESDDNFHLGIGDTGAKNNGIKLATYSDDPNLNFTTDIDGQARTGEWSIGADDGPYAEAQSDLSTSQSESPNLDLNNGLVGYWSFNGEDVNIGTTAAYDRSGNNNTGTIVGATPTVGKRGQGMNFKPSDYSDVYIEASASLNNNSSLSFSAWILPSASNSIMRIADKNPNQDLVSPASGWYFTVADNGSTIRSALQFSVAYSGNTLIRRSTNNVLVPNVWQHVVVTWSGSSDASSVHIYINNAEVSYDLTQNGTSSKDSWNNGLNIGADANNYYNIFNGKIDEVRVYNRALSAEEVGHLYRLGQATLQTSQAGKNTTGLVGHWTFDGPNVNIGATAAYDSSGNNYTGRIVGATPAIGKLGQGMKFTYGIASRVHVNPAPSEIATGDLSLSLWIKPSAPTVQNSIIFHYGDNPSFNDFAIFWGNPGYGGTNKLKFGVVNSSSSWIFADSSYSTLDASTWYHVVGTLSSTDGMIVYVNGVNSGTNSNKSRGTTVSQFLNIGTDSHGTATNKAFDGVIDDVRVYNRALSADEIGDLYRLGHAVIKE